MEGTKRPRELKNLQESLQKWVTTEKLQNVLVHLLSVQILRADDDRYELAHDSLANAIDRR